MPVKLTILTQSPLEQTVRKVLASLKETKTVIVDDTWIKSNAPELKEYAEFKDQFIALIRTVMRSRFVTDKKTEEFAISFDDKYVDFVHISLKNLDTSIEFRME